MRSIQHAKTTDNLGRYYTSDSVGALLINVLPEVPATTLLDLGAGRGALTVAASSRWGSLDLLTVDIDRSAARVLRDRLRATGHRGLHQHIYRNALGDQLSARITSASRPPDLAVCNPPFQIPKWRKGYSAIVEEAGFAGATPAVTSTDAALLFLAQNLRLLAPGGTLGIIVPDSMMSASKYLPFRHALTDLYAVEQAIRLPRDSFSGTDALAHILIVAKRTGGTKRILLKSLSRHAEIACLDVAREQAIERMDYQFHAAETARPVVGLTLGEVALGVSRGTYNSAEVKASGGAILHTTSFSESQAGRWIDTSKPHAVEFSAERKAVIAEPGDILVARVGRNLERKIVGVARGRRPISDCLFRVRVAPSHRKAVLKALLCKKTSEWIAAHAYGVAARQFSKSDLLRVPLYL